MDETYKDEFMRDYFHAHLEVLRLEALLQDVCWYSFECEARHWKLPWNETFEASNIELCAHRYTLENTRGGRHCEKASYPSYYTGTIGAAPALPPAVILNEVRLAREECKRAEAQVIAPFEWAPGGHLYEEMTRESEGVALYNELSSKRKTEAHGSSSSA
jgi:hypothetical protein